MDLTLWAWIAVAATMLIAEIAQPTGLYWPWVVGAAAAAAAQFTDLGAWWQWGAFVLIPSLILVISMRIRAARARREAIDRTGHETL